MRRLLSLCLLFALVFGAVSVRAEQEGPDPVGEWELVMDVERAYISIFEDGTMITSVGARNTEEGEDPDVQSIGGTWTFDGTTLKLVSSEGVEEILQWDAQKEQFVYKSGDAEFVMERLEEGAADMEDGPSVPLAGGWQAAEDPTVTEDMEAMLSTALEDYEADPDGYTPVTYLGSQVVAGTNHAILCTTDEDGAGNAWVIIYLYQNLQGETTVMNIAPFDFGSLCTYGAE